MTNLERPASWPVVPAGGPNLWPILDTRAVLATAAGAALPDETWAPLLAAMLAFGDLERKQRSQLLADLKRHEPSLAGDWKKLPFAKGCALAAEVGLPVETFGLAMLLFGRSSLKEALQLLGEERAFSAVRDWRVVELRPTGKSLPHGLSRLAALDTLTLLNAAKLRADTHVEELAALPQRVFLQLAFDGKPDAAGLQFTCPDLALFVRGDFRGLGFETTGSPVKLSPALLAPLARWPRLEFLSLRKTALGRPSLAELAEVHRHVPGARTLVVEVAPKGDWRAVAPGVELRVGANASPAP
jgi:hypothetical protein